MSWNDLQDQNLIIITLLWWQQENSKWHVVQKLQTDMIMIWTNLTNLTIATSDVQASSFHSLNSSLPKVTSLSGNW